MLDSTQGNLLGYLNLLTGGAFAEATLFALGVSPYITASIVIQLLTVAIPSLERMAKEGPEGQKKIKKITTTVEKPGWKCVVETVCTQCGNQCGTSNCSK